MRNIIKNLKGETKLETLENYSLLGVIIGAVLFSMGVGISAIYTQGTSIVITMLGAFLGFVSSVVVVGTMFLREALGKE